MKINVIGTGHTKFGVIRDKDIGDLLFEAANEAIESAGINKGKIDAIFIANFSSEFSSQSHLSALLAKKLSINCEITRVESACASGGLAVKTACIGLLSGLYENVLVVGAEKMSNVSAEIATSILATAGSKNEARYGATFPGLFALMAQRYLYEYKATEEDLAMVAIKNHSNALLNPLAHFQKKITIQDILKSPIIASPLKLLDCSPISDGAAAVLLSIKKTEDQKTAYIVGIGHDVDSIELSERKTLTEIPTIIRAAKKAYEMSGFEPKDIDIAEVHDCFTIAELIQMEDLGFCEKGEAKKLLKKRETEIAGRIPINPSGGLKAKGHPIGATGISQIVEIVKQLKQEAGKRQVDCPKVGLCCNIGGSGSTAIVSILSM